MLSNMGKWYTKPCRRCGVDIHVHEDWAKTPDLCSECRGASSLKWHDVTCSYCGAHIRVHEDWENVPTVCGNCRMRADVRTPEGPAQSGDSTVDRMRCPRCKGVGYIDTDSGRVACPRCRGTVRLPAGRRTIEISAQGHSSSEVESVILSALDRLHGLKPPEVEVGKRMRADSAIITALPAELDSLLAHSGPWTEAKQSETTIRTYHPCKAKDGVSVVATHALGMGQLSAALLVRDVLADWKPGKVLLVGIAAGVRNNVQLGDIVISDQIVDYEMGKITSEGMTPRWSVYRSDARLVSGLMAFKATDWISRINSPRPDGSAVGPDVHVGLILSGNKVIANAETAGRFKERLEPFRWY